MPGQSILDIGVGTGLGSVLFRKAGLGAHEFQVRAKRTKSEKMVTMYRHSQKQIDALMETFGFVLLKSLSFTVFMDRERTKSVQAKAYLARKATLT